MKRTKKIDRDVERLIGQRVRQLRMQLGMSQEALGAEVGITFQQIQKYEKGANRISVSRMLEFCEHLQTTPNEIIGWKVIGTAANKIDTRIYEAAREFAMMPEETQIAVREICSVINETLSKRRR